MRSNVRFAGLLPVSQLGSQLATMIRSFLGSGGPHAGAYEKCVGTLEDGVVEFPLSRHPKLRAAGYRVALVNSYFVLYRLTVPDEVHIARIFHQPQEYARLVAEIQ